MNKYSFVIPTYNAKNLLNNTLQSLAFLITNTNISYEVIIVDDGSMDGTGEMVNHIDLDYELFYIYLKRKWNSSRARARNEGIKIAQGTIIIFIDADIIVRPNYLLDLDRFFQQSDDMAVAGIRRLINQPIEEDVVRSQLIYNEGYLSTLKMGRDFRLEIFEELSYNGGGMRAPFLYALTCNLAVPRKWIDQTTGFDEDLIKWGIEDIEFVYRMYSKGMKIAINPMDYVLHQFHGIEQGDVIDQKHEMDVKYNTDIFIRKHPEFLNLSKEKVYALFRSILNHYKEIEGVGFKDDGVVMDVTTEEDIELVKDKIIRLGNTSEKTLRINDYRTDSDLYIWIQLLDQKNIRYMYYPITT